MQLKTISVVLILLFYVLLFINTMFCIIQDRGYQTMKHENKCHRCGDVLASRRSCLRHMKNVHGVNTKPLLVRGFQCQHADCSTNTEKFSSIGLLRQHLHDDHQMPTILMKEEHSFGSKEG